jgi:hypothetical protein
MEESFLMITDKLIIEFRASKLTISTGTGEIILSVDLICPTFTLSLIPPLSSFLRLLF